MENESCCEKGTTQDLEGPKFSNKQLKLSSKLSNKHNSLIIHGILLFIQTYINKSKNIV